MDRRIPTKCHLQGWQEDIGRRIGQAQEGNTSQAVKSYTLLGRQPPRTLLGWRNPIAICVMVGKGTSRMNWAISTFRSRVSILDAAEFSETLDDLEIIYSPTSLPERAQNLLPSAKPFKTNLPPNLPQESLDTRVHIRAQPVQARLLQPRIPSRQRPWHIRPMP
jgi:hypothetical protein